MKISFKDKKLKKCANDGRKLLSEYGKVRALKISQRLDDMRAAENLETLRHAPGRYHELTGDRKGQFACDLDQPYRLILQPHEDPIPKNGDGQFIWEKINGIEIIEIVNYHS